LARKYALFIFTTSMKLLRNAITIFILTAWKMLPT
jgi:hypothetical protein